jgi:MerR family transcriptional regulator/heat shock protein HspR
MSERTWRCDGNEAIRQGVLHDQRRGAEVQHPRADAAPLRAGGAPAAVAHRGNTRLYSDEDLEQLETILSLTRDLGVNLAGVEIILNMRRKIEQMQHEVNEFMEYVKRELARGIDDWEQRLSTALVKSTPTDLVRSTGGGQAARAATPAVRGDAAAKPAS